MVKRISKVVGALPAALEPDTLYFVRTGAGIDLYLTDTTAATAHTLNTAGRQRPNLSDFSGADYFYFGWHSVNGGWLIQRQTRATGASQSATAGHADLTAAWAERITLEYS